MIPGNPDLFAADEPSEGDQESTPSAFFRAVEAVEAKLGRPRGARNRKSEAFEKWFFAKGYKDPAQLLAEIVSADPAALASMIPNAELMDVIKMQISAAGELMPYLHGKKPTVVELDAGQLLPMLSIMAGSDQMAEAAKVIEGREVMSLGMEPEPSEINDLEGDA